MDKLLVATDGSSNLSLRLGGCGIIVDNVAYHAKMPPVILTDPPKFMISPRGDYNIIDVQTDNTGYKCPTNNRAELFAIYIAIILTNKPICILTDSKYCITVFCRGFIRGLNDEEIFNKLNGDLILLIKRAIIAHPGVSFLKVQAHRAKRDISKLTGADKVYAELNALADKYSKYDL
jgi:ribonuclease HI